MAAVHLKDLVDVDARDLDRHQHEYRDKGLIILVTRPENFAYAEKARLHPAASVEEALRIARAHCRVEHPTMTVMPQGANTLPLLKR